MLPSVAVRLKEWIPRNYNFPSSLPLGEEMAEALGSVRNRTSLLEKDFTIYRLLLKRILRVVAMLSRGPHLKMA